MATHCLGEKANYWKRAIAAETYSKFGGLILSSNDLEIVTITKNTATAIKLSLALLNSRAAKFRWLF